MSKLAKTLQAAAGNAGGDNLYVEDVFSTYLYTGNGSTQTITNGIDLAGEGGLVWVKGRSSGTYHILTDSAQGPPSSVYTNDTSAADNSTPYIPAFNSNGFNVEFTGGSPTNTNAATYASWTFRKQPKFFDVVTYTGDGVAGRTIPHNLGSVPGTIIVKSTNNAIGWAVYHHSLGATKYLTLNLTDEANTNTNYWNDTEPTSTNFTVAGTFPTNRSDYTYVAYLFAHNAGGFGDDGEQNVISCGSFTTDGAGAATVNLGYEPQWILYKESSNGGENWSIADYMRGMPVTGNVQELFPNNTSSESTAGISVRPNSTGFTFGPGWYSGRTFIYIAIRRPMKTPESGTSVYNGITRTGTGSAATVTNIGFPPDMVLSERRLGPEGFMANRLAGFSNTAAQYLFTPYTSAEFAATTATSGIMLDGTTTGTASLTSGSGNLNINGHAYIDYFMRRAPGFFDVVGYTGTGVAHTEAHNLGVAPEMMIVKTRSTAENWIVYHSALTATSYRYLNSSSSSGTTIIAWNNTEPTATDFTVGVWNNVNGSGVTNIAYLFATLDGVSKVGSYTGTGADLNVDCGFATGARFILIRRTDADGDWYVWDSARGIVAGNDPYLLLNSTAAEVTSTDYIDPLASGFTVTSSAPAALNASGGSYIFLAIA
jgi:hypothetical protein